MPRTARAVRDLADAHVDAAADLDPVLATFLGLGFGDDRLPDLSPAGQQARDDLARATLARLDAVLGGPDPADPTALDADERRCARLLRERLGADLATSGQGEHLRAVRSLFGPVQSVRMVFQLMPTATADDWGVVARRMLAVPDALAGHVASLEEGARRGLFAAPLQVRTVVEQLAEWTAGAGWFAAFAAGADAAGASVPGALRTELDRAAGAATEAVVELRRWLAEDYLPRTEGVPDGVGAERYRVAARQSTGAELDLAETYEWGWAEYRRLREEQAAEARRVVPGGSVADAVRHLEEHGEVVEGVEAVRERLQQLMDTAIADLHGTHLDVDGPVRVVEARIAPPGSAAAPYYTQPSRDFSRPGRTWLPTLGKTSFPMWNLVSVWYHEGVPGHHLQLATWVHQGERLSTFQTGAGTVSADVEGWALYAERLMDELGYLDDPGARLGYLDSQLWRAIRVVVDIGMHLGLRVPGDSPVAPGETWTADLALRFLAAHLGRDEAFLRSEVVRYLGWPGQAISYKLGERAWLAGRDAARAARGDAFDLRAWHGAALAMGSVGLDDLMGELRSL